MSDFRAYLDALDRAGQLVRVDKPVSPEFEVAAYVRKSSDTNGPAFVFTNVTGHPGWKLAAGLYGTMARLPIALGCPINELVDRYGEAVRKPIAAKRVTSGPCQEVVLTGDKADCTQLPIVVHSELDAGRYLTAGVMFGRDPQTGTLAVGLQRMQLKGPRVFGVNMPAERRVGRAYLKAEDKGERWGAAVALGVGPFVDLGSQAKIPHAQEKLGVAGALAGRPIELVPCKTVDADVPADAEIVIEGEFVPKAREPEGPFGEVAGTYGLLGNRHVFEVTAITMRRDVMYQTALTGMPTTDNHVQAWPAICESIKRMAQLACPEVVDVHAIGPYYIAVVAIKKRLAYEARNVILSVLGPTAGAPQAKYCIVVDPDVDVRNIDQVLWAIYTRCQPSDDVMIFPAMIGAPLDPSAPVHRHSSKMGFDCTVPLGESRERYNRVIVPGADEVSW
ncbi:MAG TPA: UbiD family decarboxylase [Methylomirabilota bacterium]|nr:UbiD family decarboxylase [Methylomirabilota bacterium]